MDNVVILKKYGWPIRFTNDLTNPIFDTEGFLISFKKGSTTFKYFTTLELRPEHRQRTTIFDYFDEAKYKNYIQYTLDPDNKIFLGEFLETKFSFDNYIAKRGDVATVKAMDYAISFDYYYKERKTTFKILFDNTKDNIKGYKHPVKDEIEIPTDPLANVQTNLQYKSFDVPNPRRFFYATNFGDYVNSWTVSDEEKTRICKMVTLICFKINEIVSNVFDKITTTYQKNYCNEVANGPNGSIWTVTWPPDDNDFLKILFSIKHSWGYYYDPSYNPSTSPPLRGGFGNILPLSPDYYAALNYYTTLCAFYNQAYVATDLILDEPNEEKMKYLVRLLPITAIGIIPYSLREDFLRDFIDLKGFWSDNSVSDDDQAFVLRILYATKQEEVNWLLAFLLKVEGGRQKSNFECIYDKMSDGRIFRYTFIIIPLSWFGGGTNKKYFVYSIYKHWLTSTYNISYLPPGLPSGTITDPDGFFNQEPYTVYYDENTEIVLEFKPFPAARFAPSNVGDVFEEVKYTSVIKKADLEVTKVVTTETTKRGLKFATREKEVTEKKFATYHLFQGIALLNFPPDAELQMPQKPIIPAFLFHYGEEFERLKQFDAGLSLFINITADLATFYLLGGAGILRDLHYLRDATRIGKAITGQITDATQLIKIFRGGEVFSEVVSVSSGALHQTFEYIKVTADSNNVALKEFAEFFSTCFFYITLATITTSVACRVKAANAADDILRQIDELTQSGLLAQNTFSQEILVLLSKVRNAKTVCKVLIENTLNALDFGTNTNRILAKFHTFSEAEKVEFFNDFIHLHPVDNYTDWLKLNFEFTRFNSAGNLVSYTLVDIWRTDVQILKHCRGDVEFLVGINRFTHQKTHELSHITELHNKSLTGGFKPAGAHTYENIAFDELLDPDLTSLPSNLRSKVEKTKNGHKTYDQVFFKKPTGVPGGTEFPPGSGIFYSRKTGHTIWNRSWDEIRIREEMAFAWSKRKVKVDWLPTNQPGQREIIYKSVLTDGTKVEFKIRNFDNFIGQNYMDHLSIFNLIL